MQISGSGSESVGRNTRYIVYGEEGDPITLMLFSLTLYRSRR